MKKRGVLVIAHGSSKKDWVKLVDQAMGQVQFDGPLVTSFLEMVEGRTILDGIQALESQGVQEMFVVPLFVSSGSTHIEEISYLLGLEENPTIEIDEQPFPIQAKLHLCSAMDDHPLINQIVIERTRELSTHPETEILLLVGHGSDLPGFQEKWEQGMANLALRTQQELGLSAASFATMHPDNLNRRVKDLSLKHRVLVLPLFLSEGYFTRKVIPSRLEGLEYVYTGKTFLPHTLIPRWVESVLQEKVDQLLKAPLV
ncbi:sirohydrochlorin chelatase [Hazenella coriacea]|uniref:Sirohydrochlorin ferrochelatase n=1 Tax=Hazenella coriacea TaxID=1179467 RepID=A0A4R3LEI3_9BACL|nr:CbiX/SirB N-terminal domain-containing protein [Hazenella coriacea]TCS95866.1 sirohydrochlorin ferrochelatase [Hazenella coriacea]